MKLESAANRSSEFKLEIQGLRAIGALLVAIFHIWVGRVSGGVDVFFVVSGYLILGSLIRQAEKNGRIDLLGLAYRLSKRLLPAALFVVLATGVGALLWLPQTRWEFVSKEMVASALYLENWKLIKDSVDYLAREELPSPLQHYWAIAIQGQFYVIFGVALAGYLYLLRRFRGRKANVIVPVSVILLGSFVYSVWLTAVDQPTAYFSTFTRLWEFALGGMLAAFLPKLALTRATRVALGWVGMAAVLTCGALLPVATVFPGYAALWPTLGACCVIAAGRPGSLAGADNILASRPLAFVGKISYSLYLWHWPVLIFYRAIFDVTTVGLVGGCSILALSILLSALTERFVEQPFIAMEKSVANPWPWLMKAAGGVVLTLIAAGAWYGYIGATVAAQLAVPLDLKTHPGALVFDGQVAPSGVALRPSPLAVREDKPTVYDDGCHQSLGGSEVTSCTYGDANAATTIAVVGGSHSAMWVPALQEIARGQDLKIVSMTKSSCLFSTDELAENGKFEKSCAAWNKTLLDLLLRTKPTAIFTTATRGHGDDEKVTDGFLAQWRALERAGIMVIAVRDTPWMMFDVAECVDTKGATSPDCSRPRAQMLAGFDPLDKVADVPSNLRYIDLSRYFCDDRTCPPVAGNVLMYSDRHHISATYARTLSGVLGHEIQTALNRAISSSASQNGAATSP